MKDFLKRMFGWLQVSNRKKHMMVGWIQAVSFIIVYSVLAGWLGVEDDKFAIIVAILNVLCSFEAMCTCEFIQAGNKLKGWDYLDITAGTLPSVFVLIVILLVVML